MALEQETDTILRVLAEKTIGGHNSYRLDALNVADIPAGIKAFFKAEIRRRLTGDLEKSSWFNGIRQSDAGSARVAQTLIVSLTDAYQVSRHDFLDTLDLAVHFVGNYLCRPQWTLENFLFDRALRISVTALLDGLAWVSDYRYLGELAWRTLQRRGLGEIERKDFQVLIARIDEEVVRQHNARELAALMRPLFTFFQIGSTQPDGAIPFEAVQAFFDDKKLHILKEYVRGVCHLRNKTHVTLDELAQLIEDLSEAKPATNTSQEPVSVPPLPVTAAPPAAAEPELDASPPIQHDPTVIAGGQQKVNIALSLTFAGLRGSLVPRAPLPALSALIQPEQRDRFITQLFKGDAAQYAGALVILDSLKSWHDAETYLAELSRTNNLDPQATDVAEFSEAIRRRYPITEKVP